MNQKRFDKLALLVKTYSIDKITGEVRSITRNKVRKPYLHKSGYMAVTLCLNNQSHGYKIHELVAYVGGLELVGKTVNHKDGNKLNNSLENLETVTLQENLKHSWENGLQKHIGENNPFSKLSNENVREIREAYHLNRTSFKRLADKFGVSVVTIRSVVHGLSWKHVS